MSNEEIILVDASVEVDDDPITVSGNTLSFTEGHGTSKVEGATNGGRVVPVHSEDVTTKVGMIKFDSPASISNLNITRDIKQRGPGRVVRISGTDSKGNRLGRTLVGGVLANDPEKNIQNEGKISLEFSGAPLIAS